MNAARSGTAPGNPLSLMYRFYRYVLPDVRQQLGQWRGAASAIPDAELRKQALASLSSKQFHCEGGAVYAACALASRHVTVPLITAFQTISDYLDNLCDRSVSLSGDNFRLLHQSMLDAVDPSARQTNYYALNPQQEDGGYLSRLVQTCQTCLCLLPSYERVKPLVVRLVGLYCDLQVYKHIHPDRREAALNSWWEQHQAEYPDLLWQEFAAATGSTLGVFMLFLAAAKPDLPDGEPERIVDAYFPSIAGVHILLDYLIDQEEDVEGGDLNFCAFYDSPVQAAERIGAIVDKARSGAGQLAEPRFHKMIVEGLLALYLSDPKAGRQPGVRTTRKLLMRKSPVSRLFFWVNSLWVRRSHGREN